MGKVGLYDKDSRKSGLRLVIIPRPKLSHFILAYHLYVILSNAENVTLLHIGITFVIISREVMR